MSRSNGNLAILDENCIPVVSLCHSPSSAPRHFHCRTRYPAGRCCTLNFPQECQVNTHDGRYGGVGGDGGRDGGGDQGAKGKEFLYGGGQAALLVVLELIIHEHLWNSRKWVLC
jgi:hypothetical protein